LRRYCPADSVLILRPQSPEWRAEIWKDGRGKGKQMVTRLQATPVLAAWHSPLRTPTSEESDDRNVAAAYGTEQEPARCAARGGGCARGGMRAGIVVVGSQAVYPLSYGRGLNCSDYIRLAGRSIRGSGRAVPGPVAVRQHRRYKHLMGSSEARYVHRRLDCGI